VAAIDIVFAPRFRCSGAVRDRAYVYYEGQKIGFITKNDNPKAMSLDAHCLHPNHKHRLSCAVNRTIKPPPGRVTKANEAQGRPMGFLIAWLRMCGDAGCTDRDTHFKARLGKDVLARYLDRATRQACRDWALARPEFNHLFEFERRPRAGEPIEPSGLA
jgi:hypothetical protein